MIRKYTDRAAVALVALLLIGVVSACSLGSLVTDVGSIVTANVPQNVSQGAAMLSTILRGLQNGLGSFGLWAKLTPQQQAYFAAAETAAANMAQATSGDAGASALKQGEDALNSLVASITAGCAVKPGDPGYLGCTPLETGILTVATAALPAIEALVPLATGAGGGRAGLAGGGAQRRPA